MQDFTFKSTATPETTKAEGLRQELAWQLGLGIHTSDTALLAQKRLGANLNNISCQVEKRA